MQHSYWKEERKDGQEGGEEAWTLEPSGEGHLGFRGLPQEASPTPPPESQARSQEPLSRLDRSASVQDTQGPKLRHKWEQVVRSLRRTFQHHSWRPPATSRVGGGCHCFTEKTEGGPREGLGPTQGHIASEGFPSANPRPILFLTTPLVAAWQREGREEVAPVPSPALGKLTMNLTEVWGHPLESFLVLSTGWDPQVPQVGSARTGRLSGFRDVVPG